MRPNCKYSSCIGRQYIQHAYRYKKPKLSHHYISQQHHRYYHQLPRQDHSHQKHPKHNPQSHNNNNNNNTIPITSSSSSSLPLSSSSHIDDSISLFPQCPPSSFPRISIAPMMDVTDEHFRYLIRLLSQHATLYTPMMIDRQIIHSPHIIYHQYKQPHSSLLTASPIIQIGGSQFETLSAAYDIIQSSQEYSEMNINCGCPATSAQKGEYGVTLMLQVESLAKNLALLRHHHHSSSSSSSLPLTIKCRIGVDHHTSYSFLFHFIHQLYHQAGIQHFILHCRPAITSLNTRDNRSIPALDCTAIYQLYRDKSKHFPCISLEVNGGIDSVEEIKKWTHSDEPYVNGIMIGRWAYKDIWAMRHIDTWIKQWKSHRSAEKNNSNNKDMEKDPPIVNSRLELLSHYLSYLSELPTASSSVSAATSRLSALRPLYSLYHGQRGGKEWRLRLADGIQKYDVSIEDIIMNTMKAMEDVIQISKEEEQEYEQQKQPQNLLLQQQQQSVM